MTPAELVAFLRDTARQHADRAAHCERLARLDGHRRLSATAEYHKGEADAFSLAADWLLDDVSRWTRLARERGWTELADWLAADRIDRLGVEQ